MVFTALEIEVLSLLRTSVFTGSKTMSAVCLPAIKTLLPGRMREVIRPCWPFALPISAQVH